MPQSVAARTVEEGKTHGEFDLDALFAARTLEPTPVKLGGHTYRVRRNLRTAEINAFWAQLHRGADGDEPAFAILLGDGDPADLDSYDRVEAHRFVAFTSGLPRQHEVLAVQRFVVAAGLRTEEDFARGEPGESPAS